MYSIWQKSVKDLSIQQLSSTWFISRTPSPPPSNVTLRSRLRLKCDGTRAETRYRLSAKRTSPFKSAGASVQSTIGSRGVARISGSNAEYTKFLGSVKCPGCPLHSPVSPSLTLPCVTVCHHVSTGLYQMKPIILTNSVFGLTAHIQFLVCYEVYWTNVKHYLDVDCPI
jgi:hypothetical protein